MPGRELTEMVDGLPNISGEEQKLALVTGRAEPVFLPKSGIDFKSIRSAFAVALHMHQPLIPAGGPDLRTAEVISNLKHMMDNQHIGDNHNAPVFRWCYKRIGEFISALMQEGQEPRVMLDYSGCLLYGLWQMGLSDVIDALRLITCDPSYRRAVEWLGCPWGHAVAPSTPVQDYRLHVQAWRHYFAALFGLEALGRVRGFSPAEMALPNDPDVAYEFVKTLRDCGFQWVLVQEHTIEDPATGQGVKWPHLPHRLVAQSSRGEVAEIVAVIKTQGSDTKLVAQMQPCFEARSLPRWELAGRSVPPIVAQIGDGENGGVMMNEFPDMFLRTMREATRSETPAMNVTEYLEHLAALGIKEGDLPPAQPVFQKRIWDRFERGAGPERMASLVETLRKEDGRFHMEGGSWTNNISWEKGYTNVLGPMNLVSALFAKKALAAGVRTNEPRYRKALFYLLATQTSCYRYWGQGIWTDYARELCRRAQAILEHDF
ncbi:MAG: glycosyl hydrolase family 57 [Planctomycetota bacterium]